MSETKDIAQRIDNEMDAIEKANDEEADDFLRKMMEAMNNNDNKNINAEEDEEESAEEDIEEDIEEDSIDVNDESTEEVVEASTEEVESVTTESIEEVDEQVTEPITEPIIEESIEEVDEPITKPIVETSTVEDTVEVNDKPVETHIRIPRPANCKHVTNEFDGTKVDVTVSDEKEPSKSPEEIEKEIAAAKAKFDKDLHMQVEALEKSGEYDKLCHDDYLEGAADYKTFMTYMLGNIFVPSECGNILSAKDYVNGLTTMNYDPYDSPEELLQHTLPENVILFDKLNKVFDDTIVKVASENYKFADLDEQICKWLSNEHNANIPTTKLEYKLLKSFFGKLIIALNTSTELALRERKTSTVDTHYKQAILYDIKMMNDIQCAGGKVHESWKHFINAFIGIDGNNHVYVHDNYDDLNHKLAASYRMDFAMETLLANTLKCFFPSVSIHYFYIIKSMYMMIRMLTIYINRVLTDNESRSIDTIIDQINTIVSVGISLYETKNYTFKQTSHVLPTFEEDLDERSRMYIINHLFTGPQYYLLKMFERSAPVLATLIANRK